MGKTTTVHGEHTEPLAAENWAVFLCTGQNKGPTEWAAIVAQWVDMTHNAGIHMGTG